MASRGRYQPQEWEREEFDNTFDAQYIDEDTQGGVQLDHCKLYVTNISRALNEEGLTTAFSKYGTLVKVHVSRDPAKRYALITYETPGEAKLAMMKLNKTEPLRLNINIAHKKNNQDSRESREDTRKMKQRDSSSYRDDASISSKGRRPRPRILRAAERERERQDLTRIIKWTDPRIQRCPLPASLEKCMRFRAAAAAAPLPAKFEAEALHEQLMRHAIDGPK